MFGWKKKEKNVEVAKPEEKVGGDKAVVLESPRVEDLTETTFTEKEKKDCSLVWRVDVPVHLVNEGLEKAFLRVRSHVHIQGFRVGKAPMDMVKKNYSDLAWDNAVEHLVRESVVEGLTQHRVFPIGVPQVSHVEAKIGEPLRFDVTVECAPQVTVTDYKGLPLQRKSGSVSDEEVTKRLTALSEGNAKLILSKDSVVNKNHFVVVDYVTLLEGKEIPKGKAENQLIEMSAPQTIEGFTAGLLGASDGETRDVTVTFPAEHPQKELAGKPVVFRVKVTAIKEKVVPPIDDEFAKDLGTTDLADLRQKIREDFALGKKKEQRQDLQKQVTDELLRRHSFAVPPTQVKERAKELTDRLKKMLMERGANVSDWEANESKMLEKNRPEAERQVRLSYVLNKIIETEKITVTDADVTKRVDELVNGSRPEQQKSVREFLEKQTDTLSAQIQEERLFDFLIENAQVQGAE